MKFLDLNGLTHFWDKIKNWSNSNFFSKRGGEINPTSGLQYIINGEQLDVSKSGNENETISVFNVDENRMEAIAIMKTGGTATQVLMADGSVKTLNASNGIAGLDSKGNVPLSQLGNLDTTVAEVVTALPTTNIKKHIYLIKDASGVTQNKYEEYIYTGDTSATYDASKWEKLGDFRATVDLANYYTKSQVDSIANGKSSTSHTHSVIINGITKTIAASGGAAVNLGTYLTSHQSLADYAKKNEAANELDITPYESQVNFTLLDIDGGEISDIVLGQATSTQAGVMISSDKKKLDGIANNANNYSLPTASSTIKGGITLGYSQNGKNYPVVLDTNGKAYVNVPWIDTNTTYDLSPYAKKSEAVGVNNIEIFEEVLTVDPQGQKLAQAIRFHDVNNAHNLDIKFKDASSNMNGFMSIRDKNKLDTIAFGATADSAITTAEIDKLFV